MAKLGDDGLRSAAYRGETLIKSDLLIEAVFKVAGTGPSSVFSLFSAWLRGKAHVKDVVAHAGHLDPVSLPYDEAVHRTLHPTVGPAVPNPKPDPLTLDLDQQTQAPQTSKDRRFNQDHSIGAAQ